MAAILLGILAWRLNAGHNAAPPPAATRDEWKRQYDGDAATARRENLLRSAAQTGDVEAAAFLADIGQSADPAAHLAAAALGGMNAPGARPALRLALSSPSVMVASNAARALGSIGHPEDLPALSSIAESADRTRRWHEAVRAVGKIRDNRAHQVLEPLLESVSGVQERLSVMAGLIAAARPESAAALERFLGRADLSPEERAFAEGALRACRGPRPAAR